MKIKPVTAAVLMSTMFFPGAPSPHLPHPGKHDQVIDSIALTNPAMKPFVTFLKTPGGEFFNVKDTTRTEQYNTIMQTPDDIQKQLDVYKKNPEDHIYNVLSLSNITGEYGSAAAHAETFRQRISGSLRNPGLHERKSADRCAD